MTQATDLGAIGNQSRTAYRGRVNVNLQAVTTQHAGTSAPSPTYANMFWFDTANNLIKLRDAANTSWITIGEIDPFKWTALDSKSGTVSSPTLSGSAVTVTGIPADIIALDITLVGVATNATSSFGMQFGTSGGLVSSGYAAVIEDMGLTTAYTTGNFSIGLSIPTSGVLIGALSAFKTTNNRWTLKGMISNIVSPYTSNHVVNGTVVLPGNLDRIAVQSAGGTFTAGNFEARWYK